MRPLDWNHMHDCTTCKKPFLCTAPMERNEDGFPDPVCITTIYGDYTWRQCPSCVEAFREANARELAEQEAEA